jgi:hypothetical protein
MRGTIAKRLRRLSHYEHINVHERPYLLMPQGNIVNHPSETRFWYRSAKAWWKKLTRDQKGRLEYGGPT